jgi:hypothetical protein
VQQLADPGEELGIERFMQSERDADALELLGRRIVAGENRRGIAGGEPQQQKHEQRHHPHHGDGGQHAAKQISEHRYPLDQAATGSPVAADVVPASNVSVQQILCHCTQFASDGPFTSPCGRGRREARGEGLRFIDRPYPLIPALSH